MDGPDDDADMSLNPAENNHHEMDGKPDFMIKLLEKLPQVVTKPVVIQHTQTVDDRFTLSVNEANTDEQQQQQERKIHAF